MILLIGSKMIGQHIDLMGQTGNLNLRRSRIVVALSELFAKPLLHLFGNWHELNSSTCGKPAALRLTG